MDPSSPMFQHMVQQQQQSQQRMMELHERNDREVRMKGITEKLKRKFFLKNQKTKNSKTIQSWYF